MKSIFDDYREMNKTKEKKEKRHKEEPRFQKITERLSKVKVNRGSYSNKPSGKAKSSIGAVLRRL